MKRRDLSAFERPAGHRSTPTTAPRRSMARITLSLPVSIADALRTASIRQAIGYRALITNAVEAHGALIRELTSHAPGRTQVPLNLPGDDLMAIDRAAHRVDANRSAFVAECLSRYLDLPSTT